MTRVTGRVTQHAGRCTICCQLIPVRTTVVINLKMGVFAHVECEMAKASDARAVRS